MSLDDCEIPESAKMSGVWTHVWFGKTKEAAEEKKASEWVDLMLPSVLCLEDCEGAVAWLSGHNVRFCDVHGWPKNEELEAALITRMQSRGCTLCKREA